MPLAPHSGSRSLTAHHSHQTDSPAAAGSDALTGSDPSGSAQHAASIETTMSGMQTACPILASRVRWKIRLRYAWYRRFSTVMFVLGVTVAMAHQRASR